MHLYFNCTLALLALINPLSRIFVVYTLFQNSDAKTIRQIVVKTSVIAALILGRLPQIT